MVGLVIASIFLPYDAISTINLTKKEKTSAMSLIDTQSFWTPIKTAALVQNGKLTERSVKVLDSTYSNFEQGLTVVCNGLIEATGDYQPRIKVGLIRKNSTEQWDTIVKIGSVGVLPFGPLKYKWKNDTLKIRLPVEYYPTSKDQIVYNGIFKLIYIEYKGAKRQIRSSNEFLIEPPSFENSSSKQLAGFLDTTVEKSCYKFSTLAFHHSREFTGTAEGTFNVWHKLRIYAPNAINPFLFEKVFTYQIYPNSVNDAFEAKDYNFDSRIDFRIKNAYGCFDYYLYNYKESNYAYSEVFSNAYSYSIDTEGMLLTANFSREVPLEGRYDLEATFSLYPWPAIRLLSLRRRYSNATGIILKEVDTSQMSYPLQLQFHDLPQPELKNVYGISQIFITNKKHYFPNDTVYILLNEFSLSNDFSKIALVLEFFDPSKKEWQISTQSKDIKAKERVKIDSGYKIKVGCVKNISQFETVSNEVLISGTYRVKVQINGKEVSQTPDFFVYK